MYLVCRLLLECPVYRQNLHSFPTRRSSDLKCQVESKSCFWAGLHRDAEAGAACLTAIDRNYERLLSPFGIRRVNIFSAHKDLILNGDGVNQIGRAHV